MAISSNTLWIVTCIKWRNARNGIPIIGNCNSRAYRNEKYARDRYDAILKSVQEFGYKMVPLDVPDNEEYEGYKGHYRPNPCERGNSNYILVFLDRNPIWDKRV